MNSSVSPVLSTLGRAARKLFLSAFVVFTFIVYAIHQRLAGPDPAVADALPAAPGPTATLLAPTAASRNTSAATRQPTQAQPAATDTAAPASTDVPPATDVPAATAVPTDVPAASGQYKDGTYTGPTVNAFYGYVQVEADVQNGQLAAVKFLQYPSDRRTSQRINNVAMPYLTTEAIQAQSANVDLISGATLTSEAFVQSLQAALQGAQ